MALSLSGCVDFERKLDIAMYGSAEEAAVAKERMEVSRNEQEAKKQQKFAEKLFEQINRERERNRLKKINYHEELHNLAQMRAKEISEYYHRNRPDGSNYKTIYDEFEKLKAYRYSSTAEVRGRGFGSPEAALKSWLTSSDSRKEILSDRIIWFAVAVYKENGNYYWVFWSIKRS